jgi:hypothetical protein
MFSPGIMLTARPVFILSIPNNINVMQNSSNNGSLLNVMCREITQQGVIIGNAEDRHPANKDHSESPNLQRNRTALPPLTIPVHEHLNYSGWD